MYEIDKKKFGSFVAELRKEKGYTQREVAQRLFISDKAVSKWETGSSIPDTALLVPLAELLEVSVTELLLCQRRGEDEPMDTKQVEDVVKKAVCYADERIPRAWQEKGRWKLLFLLSLLAGGLGIFWCAQKEIGMEILPQLAVLSFIFGLYFCFFAPMKLPRYHDENRISGMMDGCVRMNVPGLAFNNSNWPHILVVCRCWCCVTLAATPAVVWLLGGQHWYVMLFLELGGLFLPIYVVGKKYE